MVRCSLDVRTQVELCVAPSLSSGFRPPHHPPIFSPFNPRHLTLQQHKGVRRVNVLWGSFSPTLDLDRHRDVLDSDHQELAGSSILQEHAIAQHFRRGGHQH